MVKLNIPQGPISAEPLDAIRTDDRGFASEVIRMYALLDALRGLELGAYDHRIMEWLVEFEPSTVAVVCSWLERARAQD